MCLDDTVFIVSIRKVLHVTQENLCPALHVIYLSSSVRSHKFKASNVILEHLVTHLILAVTQKALVGDSIARLLLLPTSSHRWGFTLVKRAWKRKYVSSGRFFWFLNPPSVHLNLDQLAPESGGWWGGDLNHLIYEIRVSTYYASCPNTSWNQHSASIFIPLNFTKQILKNPFSAWFTARLSPKWRRVKAIASFFSAWLLLLWPNVNLTEMAMLIEKQSQIRQKDIMQKDKKTIWPMSIWQRWQCWSLGDNIWLMMMRRSIQRTRP